MIKIIISALLILSPAIVSIYSYQVPAANNGILDFNDYRHKKILLVNIASGSNQVGQLAALQQLYAAHSDSLVVVAFPSNSFGNEPKSDSEIVSFMQQNYQISFPIAAKSEVKGSQANVIYKWLENKTLNDVVSVKMRTDFQKYLIDERGKIIGQFDSSISPLSAVVQNAIRVNH